MPANPTFALIDHVADLEDPRMAGKCRHKLQDMVVIAISGMLCSADDWVTIAHLDLPNGIPSHDTFSWVFALVDPQEFARCFSSRMQAIKETIQGGAFQFSGPAPIGSRGPPGRGCEAIPDPPG